ncbi:MAG TPA: hypothetical protein VNO70_13150, partial [Blastocatellia bacterium]|nr:hypothetical protein [Blastocatellia bacterium]
RFSAAFNGNRSVTVTPNGLHLVLKDESEVDSALALIRQCGGRLVSINPRRTSLEDIFSNVEQST